MTAPTLIDRLRIERAVWSLDFLVQDLPGRSSRAARRDVRANLLAAAADVGTSEALRQLGPLRALAAGYLDAEYGEDGRRPRWFKGAFWLVLLQLFILGLAGVGLNAFEAGLVAADPNVTGTFRWTALAGLGITTEVVYVDGRDTALRGSFDLRYLLFHFAAYLIGARLWRLLPPWRRRRVAVASVASDQ